MVALISICTQNWSDVTQTWMHVIYGSSCYDCTCDSLPISLISNLHSLHYSKLCGSFKAALYDSSRVSTTNNLECSHIVHAELSDLISSPSQWLHIKLWKRTDICISATYKAYWRHSRCTYIFQVANMALIEKVKPNVHVNLCILVYVCTWWCASGAVKLSLDWH